MFNLREKEYKRLPRPPEERKKEKKKYLFQALVLCEGPIGHDRSSNRKKDIASNGLCSNVETEPLIDLCCVISTSHNVGRSHENCVMEIK